jgi:hypothetical protein
MGHVANAGLADLVTRYDLTIFVETGTGRGDSIRDALAIPAIREIRSIEIDPETYNCNVTEFNAQPRVILYHDDSRTVLPTIAESLPTDANVLWYLDAHFPGSFRIVPTPMLPLAMPASEAVPLVAEIEGLLSARSLANDVVVVDDLLLWEAGPYTAGDTPGFREQLKTNDLAVVETLLEPTHQMQRLHTDQGYAVFHPITRQK